MNKILLQAKGKPLIIDFLTEIKIEAAGLKIPKVIMNPAYSGGKLLMPAFPLPVVVDLSTCRTENNIPLLYLHDLNRRVGHTTDVTNNGKTITINGLLSSDNEDSQLILEANKNGAKWQASIGSGVIEEKNIELIPKGKKVNANGQIHEGPLLLVSNIPIVETSFTSVGADRYTDVIIKASGLNSNNGETKMNFEQWLKDHGFDVTTISEELVGALKLAYEKETGQKAEGGGSTENVEAEGGGSPPPPKKEEGGEGKSEPPAEPPKDEEKKITAAGGTKKTVAGVQLKAAGLPHNYGNDRPSENKIIEAALLQNTGIQASALEKLGYSETELDASTDHAYRGLGIQDLFRRGIQAAGMRYDGGTKSNYFVSTAIEAMRELHGKSIRAAGGSASGFSSINVPGILSNVANKKLLQDYNSVIENGIAMKIAGIGSASDFKPTHSYQFDMTGELVEIQQGGNLEHLSFVESERTNRIRSRGAIVTLTREMIINDDMQAFARIPQQFGRKAAMSLESKVLKTFFENKDTLFNESNGNLTDKALSIDGLSELDALFQEQTGLTEDAGSVKNFILLAPKYLLVPNRLNASAKAIYKSTSVNETTSTNRPKPVENIWQGSFEPITSPFLGLKGGLGGTSTNYWLLADPNVCAAVEVLFLNGNQAPVIESSDTVFENLGITWRCYYDFGVGLGDHRAAVMSTGTVG